MGLFEKLFPKPNSNVSSTYWKTLTAYTPVFTTRSGGAYESELIRLSINAKATHISKLNVVFQGSAKPGTVLRLKRRPNNFQTWSQFLYRLDTILEMQNTAFIVPLYDDMGKISGLYPILPSQVKIVDVNGEPWLKYTFRNMKTAAIPMSECRIMTKFQYEDDIFGGSTTALNDTLDLISYQKQGLKEAIKNGATYRFMAKLSNMAKAEDLAKERKRFNENNFKTEEGGGLLLFPSTYSDMKQIDNKAFTIDASQMTLIQTNVYNYFGVNENILQSKATADELDAFYNSVVEPFMIQFSELITSMLFTPYEIDRGNKFILASNRLQYMSTTAKISMAQQLGDRGMILIDEIREIFNLPPLPDGKGQQIPIRGEYYMLGTENTEPQEGDEPNANEE